MLWIATSSISRGFQTCPPSSQIHPPHLIRPRPAAAPHRRRAPRAWRRRTRPPVDGLPSSKDAAAAPALASDTCGTDYKIRRVYGISDLPSRPGDQVDSGGVAKTGAWVGPRLSSRQRRGRRSSVKTRSSSGASGAPGQTWMPAPYRRLSPGSRSDGRRPGGHRGHKVARWIGAVQGPGSLAVVARLALRDGGSRPTRPHRAEAPRPGASLDSCSSIAC